MDKTYKIIIKFKRKWLLFTTNHTLSTIEVTNETKAQLYDRVYKKVRRTIDEANADTIFAQWILSDITIEEITN